MFNKTLCALVFVAMPIVVLAAQVHIGSDYFLKGSEKSGDDVYVLAPSATFAGAVSGDAVAVAEGIVSQGEISADAFFVGERVLLGGSVGDDARLLGAQVIVSGEVSDDLLAIGPEISLLPSATVLGNLYTIGGREKIAGQVAGSVRSFARETRIEGSVGGTVEVWGKVFLGERAAIGGDLIYHASREVTIPSGARVGGEVIFDRVREGGSGLAGLFSGLFSLQILMMLAFAFALLLLARERTEEVLLDAISHFWPRVLRGLIILVLLPVAAALLFASVVLFPIGIALAAFFIASLLAASASAGILVGLWVERVLFKRAPFPLWWRPVLLGILALSLISVIPYVGLLIHAVLLLAALGGVGTVCYKHLKEVR